MCCAVTNAVSCAVLSGIVWYRCCCNSCPPPLHTHRLHSVVSAAWQLHARRLKLTAESVDSLSPLLTQMRVVKEAQAQLDELTARCVGGAGCVWWFGGWGVLVCAVVKTAWTSPTLCSKMKLRLLSAKWGSPLLGQGRRGRFVTSKRTQPRGTACLLGAYSIITPLTPSFLPTTTTPHTLTNTLPVLCACVCVCVCMCIRV